MIPKILHIIWIGDEAKRPNACIRSWREHHPDWEFMLWDNEALAVTPWQNYKHMNAMWHRELNGVADMMRWEILLKHGGVLVDADSLCLAPMPEWLRRCEAWVCSENELLRPGLLAAGYMGSLPGTPFLRALVEGIYRRLTIADGMAWETVGPKHLTNVWRSTRYQNLTVLPSHFFIPRHFAGGVYDGGGPIYADQKWCSTLKTY